MLASRSCALQMKWLEIKIFVRNSSHCNSWTRLYLITGLDCGLDCWTGLKDWITGLNLFISHDFHPIKCCKFGYSNCLTISCTSSLYCMLGNVHECTVHKPHGRMCIMNSWCTRSELKALSDYSKHERAGTDKGLFNVLPECHVERWCQMLYWLVVAYVIPTVLLNVAI